MKKGKGLKLRKIIAANVRFLNSQNEYSYFCFSNKNYKKNDIVVVSVGKPENLEFKVAKITKVDVNKSAATKWIIDKIDVDSHLNRIKKLMELQQKKNEIMEKQKELLEQKILKQLAIEYPELKEDIDIVQELEKEI